MSPLGLAIPHCLAAPTRLSNNATRVRLSDSGYGSRESQSDRLLLSRRVAAAGDGRSADRHVGLGQNRKYRCFHVMSALPHKADINCRDCDVRFVPLPEVLRLIRSPRRRG
jgi:hypothetical protein